MDTPICDFVRSYVEKDALRLHMPGHKGCSFLGMEHLDITEIEGADSLYEADGIIRQSEKNASSLFECETYYSTEGSSQCIRAMLYLALLYAKIADRQPLIMAGRNVHKTFLSAVALLGLEVEWLYSSVQDSYLSCDVNAEELGSMLKTARQLPAAVYLTSPDYLGKIADIQAIAQVCHQYGVLLLVDNAHGAYLKFLPESLHPIDLGADICCDSAHKTLPVLTGGAYLHISPEVSGEVTAQVKNALALFGSTSPSYLILQSLDAANKYLSGYPDLLNPFLHKVHALKQNLRAHGYCLYGSEPLKLTVAAKKYGYTGIELADSLLRHNMVCEFADPDFLVLMLTQEIGEEGLKKLEQVLLSIAPKLPILEKSPEFHTAEQVMSVREAMFSLSETIPVEESSGRILGFSSVGCPPAVPILVCGERIDENAIRCFRYYGVKHCCVVRRTERE